jgi:hypothetical protein
MDDILIDDKGYHYSMVLSENELRILTRALMALGRDEQTIIEEQYGKCSELYDKLCYPLTEGVTVGKVPHRTLHSDLDAL